MEAKRVQHATTGLLGITLSEPFTGPSSGDLGPMVRVRFTDGLVCWVSVRHLVEPSKDQRRVTFQGEVI